MKKTQEDKSSVSVCVENEYWCSCRNVNVASKLVLSVLSSCWSVEVMSKSALLEMLEGIYQLGKEVGTDKKFFRYMVVGAKGQDRENLVKMIYEMILSLEDLSLLPGFGMTGSVYSAGGKTKVRPDALLRNPEKMSLFEDTSFFNYISKGNDFPWWKAGFVFQTIEMEET